MVAPVLTHNRFAERLRADDAVLVIVDGQSGRLAAAGAGGAREALCNNLVGLARLAHAFGVPTLLGVSAEDEGGPVLRELLGLFGSRAVLRRRAGPFWADAPSREAVLASGRHHLILASLSPNFALADLAIEARRDGLDVHAVLDASAGADHGAERVGLARMTAAGVHLTGWVAVLAELAASGGDGAGGNGADAVRDNLERYAAKAGRGAWIDPLSRQ